MSFSPPPDIRFSRRANIWFVAIHAAFISGASVHAAPPYNEGILLERNIQPTATGLRQYFQGLHPGEEQRRRAEFLIQQLGDSESFQAREAATAQLLVLPVIPVELLTKASQSKDPEVRWRASRILIAGRPESERVLYAAYKTVEQKKIAGLVPELLAAVPLCDKRYLRDAARSAINAVARVNDAEVLRRALEQTNVEVKIAAIEALQHALGKRAGADLEPLLESTDQGVKLAAARAVANHGDRRSLAILLELMSADAIEVRAQSANSLRQVTGQRFGFAAYDKVEKRTAAVEKWRAWMAAEGQTAKLQFPLKASGAVEIGRTIHCDYRAGRVVELDAQGNELREIRGHGGPWGASNLPNGNILVNWYSSSVVAEYDPKGKEVWKYENAGVRYAWSAERLPNGNTLIAHQSIALEVDPRGNTVSQTTFESSLSNAIRLENGNTLAAVVGAGKVVEADPAGKAIWEIANLNSPYRIQRLENGNTLVAERGRNRAVEFDATGKRVVWSYDQLSSPDSAQRLSNGNTLVSDSQFIREIDATGKVVWKKNCTQSIVWRY